MAWSEWTIRTGRLVRAGAPRAQRTARRRDIDPFCALEVQISLGRLERELAELELADDLFARAHHLYAARLAYDQLLGEACGLAGVMGLPERGPVRRLLAEAELRARGWTW